MRFSIGDPVRIKDNTTSVYAGREDAWVRYPDESRDGYYVRVGIVDHLWYAADEIEPRRGATFDVERLLRQEWWMNHACPPGSQYSDDGEMSCGSCGLDFKRMPLEQLYERVCLARGKAASEAWEEMQRGN